VTSEVAELRDLIHELRGLVSEMRGQQASPVRKGLISTGDVIRRLNCSPTKFQEYFKRRPGFPKAFPGYRGRYMAEQVDAWIASQAEPQG
jgi:hypothetical protein